MSNVKHTVRMWHRAVCLLTVHSICVLNYKFGYIVFIVVENATYLILVSLKSVQSGKGLHQHAPTFVLHLPFHLPGFDPRWTLPHKIALSHGEIWTPPHLIQGTLGPHKSVLSILTISAIIAQPTHVPNTQTHGETTLCEVCRTGPHLCLVCR